MLSGSKKLYLLMIMKGILNWKRLSKPPWLQRVNMSTVSILEASVLYQWLSCTLYSQLFVKTGYGFKTLLEKKCADILQPDITWCGGMTEARRIVALASAYDIPIIPHGSSIYSYHLQICFPSCPMAEFLVMSPKADSIGKLVLWCFRASGSLISHCLLYCSSIFLRQYVYWWTAAQRWIRGAARQTWLRCHVESVSAQAKTIWFLRAWYTITKNQVLFLYAKWWVGYEETLPSSWRKWLDVPRLNMY